MLQEPLQPEEILYWIVPPRAANHEPNRPGSLPYYAFRPRAQDHGQTSLYRAKLIAPEEALRLFNRDPNRPQARQIAQIPAAAFYNLELTLRPDPKPHPAHLLVDFTNCNQQEIRKYADELRRQAQTQEILEP